MKTVVCLLLSLLATVSAAAEWKKVTSEEGEFTLLMPGDAKHMPQDIPTADGGKIKLHVYAVEEAGGAVAWLAFYNDYSEEYVKMNAAKDILDAAKKGALSNSNGKVSKEADIKIDEYPGREFYFSGESNGQPFKAAWRLYLADNSLYQLGVVANGKELDQKSVDKFFASFEFTDEEEEDQK